MLIKMEEKKEEEINYREKARKTLEETKEHMRKRLRKLGFPELI